MSEEHSASAMTRLTMHRQGRQPNEDSISGNQLLESLEYAPHNASPNLSGQLQYLPAAFGQPGRIAVMTVKQRQTAIAALEYGTRNLRPYHLPDAEAIQAWTAMYMHDAAVCCAWQVQMAVHQDLLANKISRSVSKQTLMLKGTALRLLREQVVENDTETLQRAVVTIGMLVTSELDKDILRRINTSHPLPFEALLAMPPDIQVMRRICVEPIHAAALLVVVNRVGGLPALNTPGVDITVATIDLWRSSQAYRPPDFPCHWTPDEKLLRPSSLSPSDRILAPGRGFFAAVAALPACFIRIAVRLAVLNQVMENLDPAIIPPSLSRTLSATQHALLSLPPWEDLSASEHDQANRHAYEISRLATAIYSNAVLLGLPHHSGWHTRLSHRLRVMIGRLSSTEDLTSPILALLTWSLVIGSMAAFRSPDRDFYETKLKEVLKQQRISSLRALGSSLEDFLWSAKACRHGVAVLWQSVR